MNIQELLCSPLHYHYQEKRFEQKLVTCSRLSVFYLSNLTTMVLIGSISKRSKKMCSCWASPTMISPL